MNEPRPSDPHRNRRLSVCVFFLALLPYFNILANGFLNFDDFSESILQNPYLRDLTLDKILTAFTQSTAGYYDPVYLLSYALDYKIWGLNPAGFHFDDLMLHAVNSAAIFWIFRRWTGDFSISFMVAGLFAVHPIHVESVCWATSRKDVLSLLLGLISMGLYLRGCRASARGFVFCVGGSLVFLFLAMATRPTLGMIPFVVALADWTIHRNPPEKRRMILYQSASWVLVAAFALWTTPMAVGVALKDGFQLSAAAGWNMFFDLWGHFIKLVLFPVNLSAFYYLHPAAEVSAVSVMLWATAVSGVLAWIYSRLRAGSFYAKSRCDLAGWGLVMYISTILPFTNIMPRGIYLADRYQYLPSLGFCAILAGGLLCLRRPFLRWGSWIALVLVWSALCVDRVPVWRNSSALWEDIESKRVIDESKRHFNLGKAYAFDGRWEDAAREYEQARVEEMDDPEILMAVANTFQTAGRRGRAETLYMKLLEQNPGDPQIHAKLVFLDLHSGDFHRARQRLEKFPPETEGNLKFLFSDLIRAAEGKDLEMSVRLLTEIKAKLIQNQAGPAPGSKLE